MRELIARLLRWIARNALNLLVILAILLAANYIRQEWKGLDPAQRNRLLDTQTAIEKTRQAAERQLLARVPAPGSTAHLISDRLRAIEREQATLRSRRQALWDGHPFERELPGSRVFRELIELDIQIALLDQAATYTQKLAGLADATGQLTRLDARMRQLGVSIQQNRHDQWRLAQAHPWTWRFWASDAHRQMQSLKSTLTSHEQALAQARSHYASLQQQIETLQKRGVAHPFSVASAPLERVMQPLTRAISEAEHKLSSNPLQRVMVPLKAVLPTALWILLAVMVTPYAIKLLAFYVIAPLATRRPGICLLPGSSGLIRFEDPPHMSAVSRSVILDDQSELLVHPEFLQSASLAAKKETKWLLDWFMPLTSLLAGMVGLTRIFPDSSEPVVISSSTDPLSEISEIVLPAAAAVVLQPRCLAGIVQDPDKPLHIKAYWRFGLSNWLTLQVRYVVFHGPARLFIKGCRGIRIEAVNSGRAINQASTLGYSAKLVYGVTRCETFGAYLMGKQKLFNDRFSGQTGFCIYEETPHPDARTGITGRGIEGVIDSFLKIFGI